MASAAKDAKTQKSIINQNGDSWRVGAIQSSFFSRALAKRLPQRKTLYSRKKKPGIEQINNGIHVGIILKVLLSLKTKERGPTIHKNQHMRRCSKKGQNVGYRVRRGFRMSKSGAKRNKTCLPEYAAASYVHSRSLWTQTHKYHVRKKRFRATTHQQINNADLSLFHVTWRSRWDKQPPPSKERERRVCVSLHGISSPP